MIVKVLKKYESLPIQIKASFWFLICSFMQKGISVITTPIFTRLMTTSEYGNYNVFNSWLGIVTIFVSLNLSWGAYAQGLIKFEEEQKEYSSSLQGLTVFLTSVWTIIYLLTWKFWNSLFSLTTVQMLSMFVMIWATSVFNFWSAEQRVDYKFRLLVFLTILVSIAKPVTGIVFVIYANDKVTARILALALVELIAYAWLFFIQMYRGKKFYIKKFWIHALAFNIPLIPHYLSQTALNSADRIMIKGMIGESSAGIYSLAYSISLIMTLFNTALGQTISPWIYKKIKEKQIKAISKVAYASLIIIGVCNILLIAFAPEAVALFAPATYYEAIWIIPPVAMSVYFMYAYDLFAKFEFYFAKTKLIAIATVLGAILNIVLNYIFIGTFGYYAAGYTTLVCYILYALFHFIAMRKVCQEELHGVFPYDNKKLLLITGVFLTLGFSFLFLYKYFTLRYTLITILILIVICKRNLIKNALEMIISTKRTY